VDRGVYAAASGGLASARLLEIVGNNLANASTVGFKAERLVSREQDFSDTLAGALQNEPARAQGDHERVPGVTDIASVTDFAPGPVTFTGAPLNVALGKQNQFFVVQTPEGEAYTRAGNFTMDSSGFLTTSDGMQVMGEGGPIAIGQGTPMITSNGNVVANGQSAGRLRVVEIDDLTQLQRQGGVRFTLPGGQANAVTDPEVIPQSVEMPNISVVLSMVDMINAQRAFESYTKSVRTINELDDTAIRGVRSAG
jgi:flagellar basal-body rod protein FlgF